MEDVIFNKLGKLKYAAEYMILGESKKVVKASVINNNTEDYDFIKGTEKLDFDYQIEDEKPFYNCKVQFTSADENRGDIIGNVRIPSMYDLQMTNNLIKAKFSGVVDDKIIDKDSKESVIDEVNQTYNYNLPIVFNKGTDEEAKAEITITTDLKNKICINELFTNVVDENNELVIRITMNKDSYTYFDFTDEKNNNITIQVGKWNGKEIISTVYDDYKISKDIIAYSLANLCNHFSTIDNDGELKTVEYDEFGFPMSDSNSLVRYEKYYDEDDTDFLDSIITLHPLYLDLFDTFENGNKNIWILDQVVFSEVDKASNLVFYSREVRELTDEENRQLSNIIITAPEDQPILNFMDMEEYQEDFREDEDRATIVEILGSKWVNNTNLFKKENNFDDIDRFEEIVQKSIDKCFIDYFFEVATTYDHPDRDPEYIDEVFSAEELRSAVMLQDCDITRNKETGTYTFACRIQFFKYIKQKWAKNKLILINDFDVFGNKFVIHEPRQLRQVL